MNKVIDCPVCHGKAKLTIENTVRTFRKEEFDINEFFYCCEICSEQFTTTEVDEINISQVFNQFREKHNIPFPDEIQKIREEYNISAKRMSEILGFGINQFRNYEKGEIPNLSNANLIRVISDINIFTRLIKDKKEIFSQAVFDKIINHLERLGKKKNQHSFFNLLYGNNLKISRFTGYRLPDIDKLLNIILFFLRKSPFVVKLNKLLFYSDFLHFKYHGRSITGFQYAAIHMGPVIDKYSYIFDYFKLSGAVSVRTVEFNDDLVEKLVPNKVFNETLFSSTELNILKFAEQNLVSLTTQKLVDLSHKETGWMENIDQKGLIDYQKYAPLINVF